MPAPQKKPRKKAGELLSTLRRLAEEEREDFLDTECGEDRALRREVTSMLGASTESDAEDEAPISDKYIVQRLHQRGGLGSVWLATDVALGRDVAIKKLLPKHVEESDAHRRFVREARVTGQLEHPNIVPVYELCTAGADRRPYYTMRFLRGKTLRKAIADFHGGGKRVRWRQLRRLLSAFTGVCNAVAYAHSRGIVHRDLKPDNVMLGDFGELILLDWGLAKMLDAEPADEVVQGAVDSGPMHTRHGHIMGTPAYMAPEQARGDPDAIDARTDVYGLGAILFEILTGRPPHVGEDSESTLEAILRGDVPRPRAVRPSVPPALDAICCKALAVSPADRYPEASALAADIERWMDDDNVSAFRDPLGVRLARWGRRHRKWVYATTGALIALTVALGLSAAWFVQMAETERVLRQRGMRGAAQFAARTVASEISLRWRILEAAATEPRLQSWLTTPVPVAGDASGALTQWLREQYESNRGATRPTSWFLTARSGLQLARWPRASTIGRDFSFRDYFHGRGEDLDPETAPGLPPIQDVHRSIVFRSQATASLMVAFSVPVRSPDRSVLGVLAMTVEVGRFGVLQSTIADDQVSVLIDTRRDWQGRGGLVLHHPRLVRGGAAAVHIPGFDLERLTRLRKAKLQSDRAMAALPLAEQLTQRNAPWEDAFDTSWQDPFGAEYSGPWWAAFEPVLVRGRSDEIRDTGWVVVIQERG